jgi:hypothetical protein
MIVCNVAAYNQKLQREQIQVMHAKVNGGSFKNGRNKMRCLPVYLSTEQG